MVIPVVVVVLCFLLSIDVHLESTVEFVVVGGGGAMCKAIFMSNPIKVEAEGRVGLATKFQCGREKYIGFR